MVSVRLEVVGLENELRDWSFRCWSWSPALLLQMLRGSEKVPGYALIPSVLLSCVVIVNSTTQWRRLCRSEPAGRWNCLSDRRRDETSLVASLRGRRRAASDERYRNCLDITSFTLLLCDYCIRHFLAPLVFNGYCIEELRERKAAVTTLISSPSWPGAARGILLLVHADCLFFFFSMFISLYKERTVTSQISSRRHLNCWLQGHKPNRASFLPVL